MPARWTTCSARAERRADVRAGPAVGALGDRLRHHLQHRRARTRPSAPIAGQAAIARYAWGDDYHVVIQRAARAHASSGCARRRRPASTAQAYVDTGPVQERVYAQHAGLGWIGKNTCVINPEHRIVDLPVGDHLQPARSTPDAPALDQCGTCTLCLDACPTGALVEPRVLDSTRCLSYLTIEIKGAIPDGAARRRSAAHAYGCDICQEVCP